MGAAVVRAWSLGETNQMNITIQIPTELSYWGSDITSEEIPMIADRMEALIQNEFGGRHDITFERTGTPSRRRVHCPDAPDIAEEIAEWIGDNWIQAL